MTPEQEAHLSEIKRRFCAAVDDKYRAGQREHGGDLWKKPGLFPMLKDETRDFIVYADTMEQQLREILDLLMTYDKTIMCEGVRRLKDLLDGPTD